MATERKHLLLLTLLGCALFWLANGQIPVTDPVESNYTQTAKEMILAGDYMSPRIFGDYWYDKPIFFYWELIAAFKVFGFTDFAARFFPGVFGVIGLWLTYFFARRLYDERTAFLSGLMLATSFGYWIISKTVITDLTLFVFFNAVLVFFYLGYTGTNKNLYYLCYIFSGLAVLTKGPVGIALPGLIIVVFLLVRRDLGELLRMKLPGGIPLLLAVTASWYYPMYVLHGDDFINTFLGVHNVLRATVSEHPMWDVWWYYSALFFIVFFPWGFVTLPPALWGYIVRREWPRPDRTTLFLLIWALVINIFFQNMATKYTTYTLPALLPIVILSARFLYEKPKLFRGMFTFSLLFLVLSCLFWAVPWTNNKGYSGKDVAAFLTENVKDGDLVLSYGDYKVSRAYYSDLEIFRLEPKKTIAEDKPDGKSWNSKNVMPYWALEDIPKDRTVFLILGRKRDEDFEKNFKVGEWTFLKQFPQCRVFVRKGA